MTQPAQPQPQPKIYERQQRESTRAYAAFVMYCEMGADRSLEKVSQKCSKNVSLLRRWSSRWRWVERAKAYDAHLASLKQAQEEAEIQAIMHYRYANVHTRIQALDKQAALLEEKIYQQDAWGNYKNHTNVSKFGEMFNRDLFAEFRATLDDIASELGHRAKTQNINVTELPKKVIDRDDYDAV